MCAELLKPCSHGRGTSGTCPGDAGPTRRIRRHPDTGIAIAIRGYNAHSVRALRFLHAADLHLDSPFRGQVDAAPEVGPALREATFRSFANLVDRAVAGKVDFVLLAGDLYDVRDRSLRAQLALRDQLARLDAAGIPSFVVHGNHDPLSGRYAQVRFPDSVHVFGAEPARVEVKNGPETIATVTGASYARAEVTENLAASFLRPEEETAFPVALLHANLGGNTGHANYAPCAMSDLAAAGFRYWALGHVHTQAVHRTRDGGREVVVAYPGNPQGRSVRETGPRGALLVEVSASGEITTTPWIADEVRWHRPVVSIEGLDSVDALEERIAEEIRNAIRAAGHEDHAPRGHVFRILLTGRGRLHGWLARNTELFDLLRVLRGKWLERADAERFVLVEGLEDETGREIDRAALAAQPSLLGDVLRIAGEVRDARDGAARAELRTLLEGALRKTRDVLDPLGEEELDRVLDRAVEMAIDALDPEPEPDADTGRSG